MHKNSLVQVGLVVLILWWIWSYGLRALSLVLALGITIAATDVFCYRVIKAQVDRPRPFQNEAVASWVRKVGQAHGDSFPSNHTANCFAAAALLTWYFPRRRHWFYIFAGLVGISRLTLGVHYPSDVMSGAFIGVSVAFLLKIFIFSRFTWFWLIPRRATDATQNFTWRSKLERLDQD
jgi:undecaprenyl-diphosphatase